MTKERKNNRQRSFQLDPALHYQIKKLSLELDEPMVVIVRMAIELYSEVIEKRLKTSEYNLPITDK